MSETRKKKGRSDAQTIAAQSQQIAAMAETETAQDDEIGRLDVAASKQDAEIARLTREAADREERIAELDARAVARDEQIADLGAQVLVRDDRIVALAREVDQLTQAREYASVIEQAKGVLMSAMQCGPDAFAVLVAQSQRENRKVREIAAELAAMQNRLGG